MIDIFKNYVLMLAVIFSIDCILFKLWILDIQVWMNH